MSGSRSLKGTKIYIGGEATTDLDQAGFEALTWVEVLDAGTIGGFGGEQSMNTYPTLAGNTLKSKGAINHGSVEIEMARNTSDAGQAALRAAGKTEVSYACKIVYPDATTLMTASTFYSRGPVGVVGQMGGGSEDFAKEGTTWDFEQAVIEVAPALIP